MTDSYYAAARWYFRTRHREEGRAGEGGKIHSLLAPGAAAPGSPSSRRRALHVFPGLIDCHVHFGMGEKITEYSTETANAAQGGFTTVLGYFLNNEAYGDVFRRELEHAVARAHVDFGFHFSTANELHIKELGEYVRELRRHLVQVLHELSRARKGATSGWTAPTTASSTTCSRNRRASGGPIVVCHTENIEIVNRERGRSRPRAAARSRTGRASSRDQPSPSRRCARCTWPRSSARASTSRTSPRARRST
jgi:dihydropyrimidinase